MSTKCYKNLYLVIDTDKKLEYTNVRKKKQMIFLSLLPIVKKLKLWKRGYNDAIINEPGRGDYDN